MSSVDPDGLAASYDDWYGAPDNPRRMESIQPYFFDAVESADGIWTVTGAVAAYDLRPEDPAGYRTNFICSTWLVDLNQTPEPASDWESAGVATSLNNVRLDPADFASTYAEVCL